GELKTMRPELLSALRHPSPSVRRMAVLVLPRDATAVSAIISNKLLSDSDLQVRLAALLTLADQPTYTEAAAPIVAALADTQMVKDRWLFDAAICAAAKNDAKFLLAAIRTANVPVTIIEQVAEHYARGKPTPSADMWASLAHGEPAPCAAL